MTETRLLAIALIMLTVSVIIVHTMVFSNSERIAEIKEHINMK